MSASFRKFYRESHRDTRLQTIQPGREPLPEVRPLALSIPKARVISIKEEKLPKPHEPKP
jgi:hypothetical protein